MPSDAALFIDANQYLKLYEMVAGGQILDWVEEQKAHIFVSSQIVDEVYRNKLRRTKIFLKSFKLKVAVPDHLLGISRESINKIRSDINKSKTGLANLAADALRKISESQDDVSRRLSGLFENAAQPNPDQLQRARDRKERGNPPGKFDDPLGDQINWEQLLTYCKGMKRLWIITGDGDYGIKHGKVMLLNSLLRRDLMTACGAELEISYFDNWSEGMTDFRKNVGVAPGELPSQERIEEIKKDEEAVSSPLDWLTGGDASANAAIIAAHMQRRNVAAILAGNNDVYVVPAPPAGGE
jgi:hypothetical protein